jgi:hypothetical protein
MKSFHLEFSAEHIGHLLKMLVHKFQILRQVIPLADMGEHEIVKIV